MNKNTSSNQQKNLTLKATFIELDKNIVKWQEVNGADGYEIKIGEKAEISTDSKYELNLFEIGNYDIAVRAYKGFRTKIYSAYSNKLTYVVKKRCEFSYCHDDGQKKLQSPINLFVDDNIISWDVVHFADKYRIVVNNRDFDETFANFYAFDSLQIGKYDITIKALSSSQNWAISDSSTKIEIDIKKIYRPKTVHVKDFGALGNGLANDGMAIQSAINEVNLHGGGKVIIDAGTYLTSNLFLYDNITIEIEKNAILKQIPNREEYFGLDENRNIIKKFAILGTNINDDFEFNHAWFYNYPLICAPNGTKNVAVIGDGTIELMGCADESTTIKCIAVGFGNVKYFYMDGFTVQKYNSYAVAALNSDHGICRNLKIVDYEGGCNDGVAAFNSSNFRITGCYIRSGDDSIDIGRLTDPRGDVWFTRLIDFLKPCTNIEIDNNDADAGSNSCKGLAFFVWGGGNKDRSTAEVSDVYIHNNKFRTVGIWGSQSHDALYGGYGIVPAKHIRWYDNEIGIVQNGFYYDGISDMNYFQSMHKIMNGDFEYAGLGFWTIENDVKLITEGNNHYAIVNGKSEIFQGLYLYEVDDYLFSAETSISGGSYKMFVRDLDTGTIIKEETFNNTLKEKVSMLVKVPKDANYQIGFISSEGNALYVDNVDFKATYASDIYSDTGGSCFIDIGKNENSANVGGCDISDNEAMKLNEKEIIQVLFFLDIYSIKDINNGYVTFELLIQRYKNCKWIAVSDEKINIKYSNLKIKSGKALLIFKAILPDKYNKKADHLYPILRFNSSIKCSVTRMIVADSKFNVSSFADYPVSGVFQIDNETEPLYIK